MAGMLLGPAEAAYLPPGVVKSAIFSPYNAYRSLLAKEKEQQQEDKGSTRGYQMQHFLYKHGW